MKPAVPRKSTQHRVLALLAARPLSTADLMQNGLPRRETCVRVLTYLKAVKAISVVTKVGDTTYYRTAGFEEKDDAEGCIKWHAERKLRKASGARVTPVADVEHSSLVECSLFEDRQRVAAQTRARGIKPFRCPMTVAFFGPYIGKKP